MLIHNILWIFLQCTWCLPQNLVGLAMQLRKGKRKRFRGAVVTAWHHKGCASMGCFIYMNTDCMDDQRLLTHEYGHTMQSVMLGWLYLPVAGIPSVIWYTFPALRKGKPYYSFYTERWADRWGEAICDK